MLQSSPALQKLLGPVARSAPNGFLDQAIVGLTVIYVGFGGNHIARIQVIDRAQWSCNVSSVHVRIHPSTTSLIYDHVFFWVDMDWFVWLVVIYS